MTRAATPIRGLPEGLRSACNEMATLKRSGPLLMMRSVAEAGVTMSVRSSGCGAVIAVKGRNQGKSRLAGCLSSAERVELIRAMLDRVLDATRAARSIDFTMVVSPERDTVPEAVTVSFDDGTGLNEAFEHARRDMRREGLRRIVTLPADLPRLRAEDLEALVLAAGEGVALAPDRQGTGTNAMVSPIDAPLRFRFGPDSCRLHLEEARRLGLERVLVGRPSLSFDVDSPGDLARLGAREWLLSPAV
jgi:2-phospho-L-lactate guanylyltransferase